MYTYNICTPYGPYGFYFQWLTEKIGIKTTWRCQKRAHQFPGVHTESWMENHAAIHGTTLYFDWAIFQFAM